MPYSTMNPPKRAPEFWRPPCRLEAFKLWTSQDLSEVQDRSPDAKRTRAQDSRFGFYMNCSLNSSKGSYIDDYIGYYYRGY